MMNCTWSRVAFIAGVLSVGCGGEQQTTKPVSRQKSIELARQEARQNEAAEAERIKSADVSVLYFGNSHTGHHDIPNLVGQMISFRRPMTSYYAWHLPCGFLEDAANNPNSKATIERHPWKFVVLQAQKISMS